MLRKNHASALVETRRFRNIAIRPKRSICPVRHRSRLRMSGQGPVMLGGVAQLVGVGRHQGRGRRRPGPGDGLCAKRGIARLHLVPKSALDALAGTTPPSGGRVSRSPRRSIAVVRRRPPEPFDTMRDDAARLYQGSGAITFQSRDLARGGIAGRSRTRSDSPRSRHRHMRIACSDRIACRKNFSSGA